MMKITNDENFILSAMTPVNSKGVIAANISWNFANNTPGIVGAKGKESLYGTPLRNT